jgi:hypothetical protein
MRRIGQLMASAVVTDLQQIPSEMRSMKRLWGAASSLAERREGEAKLFEAGLRESGLAESLALFAPAATEAVSLREVTEDVTAEQSDIADEEVSLEEAFASATEAAKPSPASVRWNSDDRDEPDYSHLAGMEPGGTFTVMPEDIDAITEANEFKLLPGRIVLALRGAALADGDQEEVASLDLIDQRPDHRDFRCVIASSTPTRAGSPPIALQPFPTPPTCSSASSKRRPACRSRS